MPPLFAYDLSMSFIVKQVYFTEIISDISMRSNTIFLLYRAAKYYKGISTLERLGN